MKKFARGVALLVLTLCLGVALAACGDDSKAEGKYVYSDDEGYSLTIELKDGKVTCTEVDFETITDHGTYKIKGDKLTMTFEDETLEATIKPGKSIAVDFGGGTVVTLTYQK